MSVPPLLNFPTDLCPQSIVFGLRRTVARTASPYTYEEQAFQWPGEQWHIEFQLPPVLSRVNANKWKAFFLSLKGSYGQFYMGDPSSKIPLGVATGTPVVNGLGQTGNSLATDGWTPSTANILRAGDYIQIGTGSSSRLHMVMADVNSNSSGEALLSIEPALRYSPNDGTAITVNNPVGVFRLVDNDFSWSVNPGSVYRMSFQAVEVVNA